MIYILNTIRERKARRLLQEFVRSGEQYQAVEDDRMVPVELYDTLRNVINKSNLNRSDEYAAVAVHYSKLFDAVYLLRTEM